MDHGPRTTKQSRRRTAMITARSSNGITGVVVGKQLGSDGGHTQPSRAEVGFEDLQYFSSTFLLQWLPRKMKENYRQAESMQKPVVLRDVVIFGGSARRPSIERDSDRGGPQILGTVTGIFADLSGLACAALAESICSLIGPLFSPNEKPQRSCLSRRVRVHARVFRRACPAGTKCFADEATI